MRNKEKVYIPTTLSTEVTKLSESISKPLERLFQVGGFALVFIFVGFLSMLIGYLKQGYLSGCFFGVGASIVFSCLCLFVFSQLYGPIKARHLLKENKELLDSVQDVAIKLTDTLGDVQALMFKHSEQVGRILQVAAPMLSEIPLLNKVDFLTTQNINRIIVESTEKSRMVIDDVRQALIGCEVEHLKKYSDDLRTIKISLREALKNQEEIKVKIVNYKEIVDNLWPCLLEYTESIDVATEYTINYISHVDSLVTVASRIPFIGKKFEHFGLSEKGLSLSKDVQNILAKSQEANANLRAALNEGDVESLKKCVQGLKEINSYLGRMRKTSE